MGVARQLWLLLLIPIALALLAYGLIAHGSRRRVLMAEASAELQNHATLVEGALGGAVERGQVQILKERIERLARADRILGIAAFDAQGQPILITDHIEEAAPELADLARRALVADRDLEEERTLVGSRTLVRTVTFSPKSGGPPGVATVARDLRYLDELGSALNRGLAFTGLILLMITALVAALVGRETVGRPARAIVEGVERVAAGDLDAKVPEAGAEELARLARAFNSMTLALREAGARAEREEAARAGVERRLQHAQALAAVGQVAASMAHEIGSPLNVILGRARRASDQPGCPDALKAELDTIAQQSERISRVVARLLAAARPPRGAGRGSDLASVVKEALAFIAPECRQRGVQTRLEECDSGCRVALDGDRLFQVAFNLCLNALQAQPEGGEIRVRLLRNGAPAHGAGQAAFEIEDRGPGVPHDDADHIFDPFFTSKGDRGGSGLGLAIVSGIVREAGGAVELLPTPHGGARFRVTLPEDGAVRAREARP